MRVRIPLGRVPAFDPAALRDERCFLYRRLADRDRQFLGVGGQASGSEPLFGPDGRVLDWTFGHLCYNANEGLRETDSRHARDRGLPFSHWFVPRWVMEWEGGDAAILVFPGDEVEGRAFADRMCAGPPASMEMRSTEWRCSTTREQYLEATQRFLHHIHRGDIYEANFCIERVASDPSFDPFLAFTVLQKGTDAPFSAFHRLGDRFALCMSPERFLHFDGATVTAEPMKGTRRRSMDPGEDQRLVQELVDNAKERSENVMAVDVMRNDLSRTAAPNSVQVTELCGVRTYPRIHQMVSTIVSERSPEHSPWDVVRAAFPMASMTGAPKLRAMELIDAAEVQARGLFSGTLGYFAPDGTADLNVVIRTILFDAATGRLSLSTGSALTALCDPEEEWEECALKARSILDTLGHVG